MWASEIFAGFLQEYSKLEICRDALMITILHVAQR